MLSTVVTQSANAAQVFALVAVIIFIIGAIVAFMTKTIWAVLLCAGLAFAAASLLFLA